LAEAIKNQSFFERLTSIGVDPMLGYEFNDRLKILNIFTWTCILFCTPYYITMLLLGSYETALLFLTVQILFSVSLVYNKFQKYNVAKIVILITTNYSVLCLNFTFGHDAGFFLYYFTSPLIVFSFFYFHQWIQTIFSLILYLSSYIIIELAHVSKMPPFFVVEENILLFLYYINVFLSFCFLIVLARSFSKFHNDASEQVRRKNAELNQNQKVLEQLLLDKNTLLSETHHRVKNNLAVICGMFDLHLMNEKDPNVKAIFRNSKNRIKSMSLIHESLYSQPTFSQIDIKSYILTLVSELKNSLQSDKEVKIRVIIDDIKLDLSKAIPCGLIVNEIVTNSFKHAFSTIENPEIRIEMRELEEDIYLKIEDNGIGFEDEMMNISKSLGMPLITAFSKQLEGTFSFNTNKGTLFNLIFTRSTLS